MHAKIRTFRGGAITRGSRRHASAARGRGRVGARPEQGVVGYTRSVRGAELAAALEADAAGAVVVMHETASGGPLTL